MSLDVIWDAHLSACCCEKWRRWGRRHVPSPAKSCYKNGHFVWHYYKLNLKTIANKLFGSKKWIFCFIFLLGHNILVTELMARLGTRIRNCKTTTRLSKHRPVIKPLSSRTSATLLDYSTDVLRANSTEQIAVYWLPRVKTSLVIHYLTDDKSLFCV